MTKAASLTFRTQGGRLAIGDPTYVERDADRQLLETVIGGKFCSVLAARQTGKSSLIHRAIATLEAEKDVDCVYINLSAIQTGFNADQWYKNLVLAISERFGWRDMDAFQRQWEDWDFLTPPRLLRKVIEAVVLPTTESDRSVAIFFDELEVLPKLDFPVNDLFEFIHDCYGLRSQNAAYKKLTFCVAGSVASTSLIADELRSPFKSGQAIRLGGITFNQARLALLPGLLLPNIKSSEETLREILEWTNGHPFLTQKVCQSVATAALNSAKDIVVSAVVRAKMIRPWKTGSSAPHFQGIIDQIVHSGKAVPALKTYKGICNKTASQAVVAKGSEIGGEPEELPLLLSGLVVRDGNKLRVHNRIYQQIFNRQWVNTTLKRAKPAKPRLKMRSLLNPGMKLGHSGHTLLLNQPQGKPKSTVLREWFPKTPFNSIKTNAKYGGPGAGAADPQLAGLHQNAQQIQRGAMVAIGLAIATAGIASWMALRAGSDLRRIQTITQVQQDAARVRDLSKAGRNQDALAIAVAAGRKLQPMIDNKDDEKFADVRAAQDAVIAALELVMGQTLPELKTFEGHGDWVRTVSLSPDGKTIASASPDQTVKLWDVHSGDRIKTLKGHDGKVMSARFSPDGKTLVSTSADTTLRLWDAATGKPLKTLTGHSKSVNNARFSPDGTTLVSSSSDNTLKLWDAKTGAELRTFTGHGGTVTGVSFRADGQAIASTSKDKTVKIWNVNTGAATLTLTGHTDEVRSVAFSPDGQTLVSGSFDQTVKLWDANTGVERRTLNGHASRVISVNFSADGTAILSTSADRTLRLWDANTGDPLRTLNGHGGGVLDGEFDREGTVIVSGSADKTIKLWDGKFGDEQSTLRDHRQGVNDASFSPDGKLLVSASQDKTLKFWGAKSGDVLQTLTGHKDAVTTVQFSPDGRTVLSGSRDRTLRLWNVRTGLKLRTLKGHRKGINEARFSPDGKLIVSAAGSTIKLWDTKTGKLLRTLTGHDDVVRGVAFHPQGKMIASASRDKTVKLWDVETGKEIRTLEGHGSWVLSANFSPNGKAIASASSDQTVRLWNVESGANLQTLRGHSSTVLSANFSPDGKTIVSASRDQTVKLWDVKTGMERRTLAGHQSWVRSSTFSPDGKFIVSTSSDNTVKLWKMETLRGLTDQACQWLSPWLKNPEAGATDRDRQHCGFPPRTTTQ